MLLLIWEVQLNAKMAGTRSTADLIVSKLLAKKLFTLKRGAAACRWIRLLRQFMIWFVSISEQNFIHFLDDKFVC